MSKVTIHECDWCGEQSREHELAKVKIPSQYMPESLKHIDSGTERFIDTCSACGEALSDVFESFTDHRRRLQRRMDAQTDTETQGAS